MKTVHYIKYNEDWTIRITEGSEMIDAVHKNGVAITAGYFHLEDLMYDLQNSGSEPEYEYDYGVRIRVR